MKLILMKITRLGTIIENVLCIANYELPFVQMFVRYAS